MSQDYPDATPQHEDGARILQPFAFTTGGGGDFRPLVEKIDDDAKVVKVERAGNSPKDHYDAPARAASQNPEKTDDEFAQQLKDAAESLQSVNDKTPGLRAATVAEPSAPPASGVPNLAASAAPKSSPVPESNPTKESGDSSQTSS